jgi:hypothetical protein
LSGIPIPPENFFDAAIDIERLALEQADARSPDARMAGGAGELVAQADERTNAEPDKRFMEFANAATRWLTKHTSLRIR